jgi:hypothetical protein
VEYKFVIEGKYYGENTLPDLNNYIHECSRHPQCGAKMKRESMMIAATLSENNFLSSRYLGWSIYTTGIMSHLSDETNLMSHLWP